MASISTHTTAPVVSISAVAHRVNLPGVGRPIPSAPVAAPPLSQEQFNSLGIVSRSIELPNPATVHHELAQARDLIKRLDPTQIKDVAAKLMGLSESVSRDYAMTVTYLDSSEDYGNGAHRMSAEKTHIGRDMVLSQLRGATDDETMLTLSRLNLSRSQERAIMLDQAEVLPNCIPDEVTLKGGAVRGTMCMEMPSSVRSDRNFMSVGNSEMLSTYMVGAIDSYDKIGVNVRDIQRTFGLSDPQLVQLLRSSSGEEILQQLHALAPTNRNVAEALTHGSTAINALFRCSFLTQALEMAREPKMTVLNEIAYGLGESGALTPAQLIRSDSPFGLMTFVGASEKSEFAFDKHQERAANLLLQMVDSLADSSGRVAPDILANNQMVQFTLELSKQLQGRPNQLADVCHNILWAAEGPASTVGSRILGPVEGKAPAQRPSISPVFARMIRSAQELGITHEGMIQAIVEVKGMLSHPKSPERDAAVQAKIREHLTTFASHRDNYLLKAFFEGLS